MASHAELTGYGSSESSQEIARSPSFRKPRTPSRQTKSRPTSLYGSPLNPSTDHDVSSSPLSRPQDGVRDRSKSIGQLEGRLLLASEESTIWQKKYEDLEEKHHDLHEELEGNIQETESLKKNLLAASRQVALAQKGQSTAAKEVESLTATLAKIKEERAEAEAAFSKQVQGLNLVVAELKAQLEAKDKHADELSEKLLLAERGAQHEQTSHLVIMRTLEAEMEKLKLSELDLRRRPSRSNVLLTGQSSDSLDSTKPPDPRDVLIQQLEEENDALRDELEAATQPLDGVQTICSRCATAPLSSLQSAPSPRPKIPSRSSSVHELLQLRASDSEEPPAPSPLQRIISQSLLNSNPPTTLRDELTGSGLSGLEKEVEGLRAENLALVNYLVATLESINKGVQALDAK